MAFVPRAVQKAPPAAGPRRSPAPRPATSCSAAGRNSPGRCVGRAVRREEARAVKSPGPTELLRPPAQLVQVVVNKSTHMSNFERLSNEFEAINCDSS